MIKYQLVVLRMLSLIGLAVSSALLADHVSGSGAFCGFDDPCEAVAASAYGQVFGIPLSAIGVVGFAGMYVLSLVPTRWAVLMLRGGAAAAGLSGLALLVIQFAVLRQVCPLCLVVDLSGIGLAVVALVRCPEPPSLSWLLLFVWIWAGLAAGLGPVFWTAAHLPATAPDQVRAYWEPGRITIVEVTDFDCPHCQRADPILRDVLKRHDVRLVRLVAPMPLHEHSQSAAQAYLAAVRQGKGEEMARALFAAPLRDRAACRAIAARLGLDLAAYDRSVADLGIDAELQANSTWARSTGFGLPFFWVQNQLLLGVPKPGELDRAIEQSKPAE